MACESLHMRDGHSSWTPVARRLQQPTRTAGLDRTLKSRRTSCRPYSVLLPVGFAVPPALPPTRCALTAPFHPCHGLRNAPRRSVLCGTFPELAPAGRYPAPLVHGARTFLPGNLSSILPASGARKRWGPGAAVRPTDETGMGAPTCRVKRRGGRSRGRVPRSFSPARAALAVRSACRVSIGRQCRRLAPGGNGVEKR